MLFPCLPSKKNRHTVRTIISRTITPCCSPDRSPSVDPDTALSLPVKPPCPDCKFSQSRSLGIDLLISGNLVLPVFDQKGTVHQWSMVYSDWPVSMPVRIARISWDGVILYPSTRGRLIAGGTFNKEDETTTSCSYWSSHENREPPRRYGVHI